MNEAEVGIWIWIMRERRGEGIGGFGVGVLGGFLGETSFLHGGMAWHGMR